MTFDRHAQHPYNYAQPYQQQQSQQPSFSSHQDPQQQSQQQPPTQQQQQPYLSGPLPWPPPSSGSGLVGTDVSYGQPIPSIPSPATTDTTPSTTNTITATAATATGTSSSSNNTTTTSTTQQQVKTEPTQDPNKQYHPEWGVLREQDFHPLALKHQRDLENHFQSGTSIADFYFWQANLGGYCMADMNQNIVVSSEGVFVLVRRMVEGAPHPGRKKKKRDKQ